MSDHTWTVADAKAKLSKVIDQAQVAGPQTITRHGRTAAVVVSAEEWEQKTKRTGNLAEFFAASPLRSSGLSTKRIRDSYVKSNCEFSARHQRRVGMGEVTAQSGSRCLASQRR